MCTACNLSDTPPQSQKTEDSQRDFGNDTFDQDHEQREDFSPPRDRPRFVFPSRGSTEIERDAKIGFSVNQQLDLETLDEDSFFLRDGNGIRVEGELIFDESSRTVVFIPSSELSLLTLYTASSAEEIRTIDGEEVEALSWSFTTRDGVWNTPTALESNKYNVSNPKINVDEKGNAAAIWLREGTSFAQVRASKFGQEVGWSWPSSIGNNATNAVNPELIFDSRGNLLAVWIQNTASTNKTLWSNQHVDKEWQTPTSLEIGYEDISDISLALSKVVQGVVWLSRDSENQKRIWGAGLIGGDWGPPNEFQHSVDIANPVFVANKAGTSYLAWEENDKVLLRSFGSKSPNVGLDPAEPGSSEPRLAMNRDGKAILSYRANGNVYASILSNEDISVAHKISNNEGDVQIHALKIDINDNGSAIAIWEQGLFIYVSLLKNDEWTVPELLDDSGFAYNCNVKLDREGNATAVWETNGDSVKVKRYRKTDEMWGEELRIDNTLAPEMAMNIKGEVFIIWVGILDLDSDISVLTTRFH